MLETEGTGTTYELQKNMDLPIIKMQSKRLVGCGMNTYITRIIHQKMNHITPGTHFVMIQSQRLWSQNISKNQDLSIVLCLTFITKALYKPTNSKILERHCAILNMNNLKSASCWSSCSHGSLRRTSTDIVFFTKPKQIVGLKDLLVEQNRITFGTTRSSKFSTFSFGWFSLSVQATKLFVPIRHGFGLPRFWFTSGGTRHFFFCFCRELFPSLCQSKSVSVLFCKHFWTSITSSKSSIEAPVVDMSIVLFDKQWLKVPISKMTVQSAVKNLKHKVIWKFLKSFIYERSSTFLLMLFKSPLWIDAYSDVATISGKLSDSINMINCHGSI